MSPLPAEHHFMSPFVHGIPTDFTKHTEEFVNPGFPESTFMKCTEHNFMSPLPAEHQFVHGIPTDFTKHTEEFVNPDFPEITFVKCIWIMTFETGLPTSPEHIRFVSLYARKGGRLLGPLPEEMMTDLGMAAE